MVASVILIPSDSLEESVGSSTSQVILFSTIPTVIPADVPTIAPGVLEVAVVVALPAGVLNLDIYATSETNSSSKVALHSSSFDTSSPSSPSTHVLPSTTNAPPASLQIVPAPSGIPRRPAILVLPGQEIPIGRPYLNRRRFHSSSSSPPRKRSRASLCSSSSATHSSSLVSAGPSRKRCRSPTGDSLLIRADLLPLVRDIESNIDLDILADIEAGIIAEASAVIKADAATDDIAAVKGVGDDEGEDDIKSSARGIVEIGVDVLYDHMLEFPTYRIADIEEEQRAREVRAITVDTKRARLLDKIRVLDGSVMRLKETLTIERERTASVERHLGYMTEELRRIRLTYQYDREDFRRLETFAMRRLSLSLEVKISMEMRNEIVTVEEMEMEGMHQLLRNEMHNLENELWNLSVKGTDVARYTRRFQELSLLCPRMVPEEEDKIERLMDQKVCAYAASNVENKKKLENTPRDNHMQQPPFKRQNMARSYTIGNNEKWGCVGSLPYCNK
ncbi:hypothetical protein Tco_0199283 [Tanacetum coccineum]